MSQRPRVRPVAVLLGAGTGASLGVAWPLAALASGAAVDPLDHWRWGAAGAGVGLCVALLCARAVAVTGRRSAAPLVGALAGGALSCALTAWLDRGGEVADALVVRSALGVVLGLAVSVAVLLVPSRRRGAPDARGDR